MTREFSAPWGIALILVSVFSAVILVVVCVLAALMVPGNLLEGWPRTAMLLLPLAILTISALFTVRGYTLSSEGLAVKRLLWSTRIPLTGSLSAWHDPDAMERSWRVFGNGGLFSITGLFRNAKLGMYRAWATDPKRAVVLATTERRMLVTPGDPEAFLQHLRVVAPQVDLTPKSRLS